MGPWSNRFDVEFMSSSRLCRVPSASNSTIAPGRSASATPSPLGSGETGSVNSGRVADCGGVESLLDGAGLHEEHLERLATIGTLAGLIAHEFNNILTPVVSYAQLALSNPDDRELTAKALQRALDGSEKAAAIAHMILGFSRAEHPAPADVSGASVAGCSTWNDSRRNGVPVQAVVSECVNAALACMVRDPKHDGIRLQTHIEPDARAAIRPVALQHVLLNLLLNARHAMLPRGGALSITAGPRAVDGKLEISIADSGIGMSGDQLANLFTPFRTTKSIQQNANTMASKLRAGGVEVERRSGGTGLGMTVCKRLVEEAGGYLAVRSSPGQGTTVQIVLPRAA